MHKSISCVLSQGLTRRARRQKERQESKRVEGVFRGLTSLEINVKSSLWSETQIYSREGSKGPRIGPQEDRPSETRDRHTDSTERDGREGRRRSGDGRGREGPRGSGVGRRRQTVKGGPKVVCSSNDEN